MVRFLKTESKPNFGFPHIPNLEPVFFTLDLEGYWFDLDLSLDNHCLLPLLTWSCVSRPSQF